MGTSQITVRIDEDLVRFADAEVREGRSRSRADVVAKALRRERRRMAAENDARIYAADRGGNDDLDGLATWAQATDLSDLDEAP